MINLVTLEKINNLEMSRVKYHPSEQRLFSTVEDVQYCQKMLSTVEDFMYKGEFAELLKDFKYC